jgi:hypothetical protein
MIYQKSSFFNAQILFIQPLIIVIALVDILTLHFKSLKATVFQIKQHGLIELQLLDQLLEHLQLQEFVQQLKILSNIIQQWELKLMLT